MNNWDKVFAERWEAHEEQNKQIIKSLMANGFNLVNFTEHGIGQLKVLEYGFGTGFFARFLRDFWNGSTWYKRGLRYYGAEASIVSCHVAQLLEVGSTREAVNEKISGFLPNDDYLPETIMYENGRSTYSNFFPADIADQFDYVFCSNVLEHFKDPFAVIEQLFKYSNRLYLVVPYNQSNLDQYQEEGGAGHVFSFNLKFFRDIPGVRINYYNLFESPGWTWTRGSEDPLQLFIILEKI